METGLQHALNIKSASIVTLGCRSNQYDSSAIEEMLKSAGIRMVKFPAPADVCIINTCTVTKRTDAQSRQFIRQARLVNPDAIVMATGCYAQVFSDEISSMAGVDFVIGNAEKHRILEFLRLGRQAKTPKTHVGDFRLGASFDLKARVFSGRTRANLKVQEGCNLNCSYCIIPKARGASKSLALSDVEKELDSLSGLSYKEIVLTGIHLGAYGVDLSPRACLASVLKIFDDKKYPCRLRLSSIDPNEVTEDLIEIMKGSDGVCRHLHLPLQSGDNGLLKKMRRPYAREDFASLVLRLKKDMPQISIGTDVMAGFPGEGEKEFENTFSLLKDLPISYMHIFPYSRRSGTDAAAFGRQVHGGILKDRVGRLRGLDEEKRKGFFKGFVGTVRPVVAEAMDKKTGLLNGRTDNYLPVEFHGPKGLQNTLVNIRLNGFNGRKMQGEIVVSI